jgi:hypothetical protein
MQGIVSIYDIEIIKRVSVVLNDYTKYLLPFRGEHDNVMNICHNTKF